MNSLERSLLNKAGYDHGWEVAREDLGSGTVRLTSARHRAEAAITHATASIGWLIAFSSPALVAELSRHPEFGATQDGRLHAKTERDLGRILTSAAQLARSLPNLPRIRFDQAVTQALAEISGPVGAATEVERLVRQRVGQDIYRQSQFDYWGGACAVTGIAIPELLRASHAKAWADCATDDERLNVYNGFLLCAHLDALFDRHLLTFDDDGVAIWSPAVSQETRAGLGLESPQGLRRLTPAHLPFLQHHRSRCAWLTNR